MTKWTPKFTNEDYHIVETEGHKPGFMRLCRDIVKYKYFDGSWSPELTRYRLLRRASAAVLLYSQKSDQILLIEQFRHGVVETEIESPWVLEIVAGLIDEGETPEQAAIRESMEEAGCVVEKLIPVTNYLVSCGASNEKTHVFVGIVDHELPNGDIHGIRDEGEDIKTHVYDFSEVEEMVDGGVICSAAAIIALQWLRLNKTKIT